MNRYTIHCTPEQTKKALELGASIEILPNYTEYRVFPLFISIDKSDGGHIFYKIRKGNKYICEWNSFSSRPEATLAAIDAALEYLEGQKNKH